MTDVVYWSKDDRRVVPRYSGSLFVDHLDADSLVNHYLDFVKGFGLDFFMLLHFGMDCPNTKVS